MFWSAFNPSKRMAHIFAALFLLALTVTRVPAAEFPFKNVTITVPDGFTVEIAAEAPLVGHPMMACFDERGRLFIAEAAGTNATIDILEEIKPNFIRMLEDTDSDGKFDKSTIFADNLQIPNGALWQDGALYVAEPPGIWRYTDKNNDGVADTREHIAGRVKSNGMSSTLHGPVLGPTGRLFWCGGQSGYSLSKDEPWPNHRITPGVFVLKKDGSEHEPFSVGGMANPVEVAFSEEGEVFGTVAILGQEDGARYDALMHWVYGGFYNVNPHDRPSLKESGPRLPPLSRVGQVAPAGIMRYRGSQFGDAYRDNLFWAQFNTYKIIRTQLKRKGATFEATDEDFLIGDNVDFHVTDVLQDADGSLLVVDTGGWFRWGCPTSQLAKPDVKGAIYRIRKIGAKSPEDPRGLKVDWLKASPADLITKLGDPRPAVADRAIELLSKKEERAIQECLRTLQQSGPPTVRRGVIWALSRMQTTNAAKVLRLGLQDKDLNVRHVAVHAAGMERDKRSVSQLIQIFSEDAAPWIRREAATALGRIADATAVPHLLEGLKNHVDVFLDHAIIYALIQINQPELTEAGLENSNIRIRRGALLALSQMNKANLSRGQILLALKSSDLELQKAAFTVARRNKEMHDDLAIVLREWFHEAMPSEDRLTFLQSAAASQATNQLTQKIMAEALGQKETSRAIRLLILQTIKRAQQVKQLPAVWLDALGKQLKEGDPEVRLATVSVLQERNTRKFDELMKELARKDAEPMELRIAFLNALAPRLMPVESAHHLLLKRNLSQETAPLLRLNAARALSSLSLSVDQLVDTAKLLPQVDPLVLPTLLRAFTRATNDIVGKTLLNALDETPAAANVSIDELARTFKNFSEAIQQDAKVWMKKVGVDIEQQQKLLDELTPLVEGGDFSRGKTVFFGKKSTCANCHRIRGQGGTVGPNLSQIGKIRSGRDLLESIIYPSASIVQGYHSFNVEANDEMVYSGLITRQTPDAVWIRGTDLVENKIAQKQIKSLRESSVSIMPAGFADVLTKEELRDLLRFLQDLK